MPSALWFWDATGQVWHAQQVGSYQNAARTAKPLCGDKPIRTTHFQYGGGAGQRCAACEAKMQEQEQAE